MDRSIALSSQSVLLQKARPAIIASSCPNSMVDLWKHHFPYNRKTLDTGIVHFGPGRFFRGHLAPIVHQYLTQQKGQDQRWGICGVSLNSRSTIETLAPQDFLYTLIERYCDGEKHESAKVIGSITQIIDGKAERNAVLDLLISSTIHLVTLTVTQAGYYLDQSFNLNINHNAIAHDLQNPSTPTTAIGFIVEAIRRRHDRGLAPFTTLSCDNLPRNGDILQKAVLAYAEQLDPQLAAYISDYATFPNTVVDRIVPRAHDSDHHYPTQLLQISDRGPVVTEPFYQFVVEDKFSGDRPGWEAAGVIMTEDITPYLYLKSRFLNAVHSFVACLAVRIGVTYVHEAVKLSEFQWFTQLLTDDITAATPVSRQMCEQYRSQVLCRLSNEALPDSIERIATETARKLGKYIMPILQDAYYQQINLRRLILPIAAWMLAIKESAIESGKPYCAKDALNVVTAIQAGASLSQVLGMEQSECTAMIDRECEQALRKLQMWGLLPTLKYYCQEDLYEIDAAA